MSESEQLVLIDGSGYIFRAFHALPPMTRGDGTPVNAVYGFTGMVMKRVDDLAPAHVAVVFDSARKTFRNDIYADYKANRTDPPEELVPQFDLVREATTAHENSFICRLFWELTVTELGGCPTSDRHMKWACVHGAAWPTWGMEMDHSSWCTSPPLSYSLLILHRLECLQARGCSDTRLRVCRPASGGWWGREARAPHAPLSSARLCSPPS